MAKSGRLELGYNIYGHYKSIFNQCDVFRQQSNRIRWKTQNKGYYAVQDHSRSSRSVPIESPYAMNMINSSWQPISYRFGDIAAYFSNFGHCVFEPHLGELRNNLRCSSWAHWKARSGLPISDNWTFFARCYGWGARAEIDRKSVISL